MIVQENGRFYVRSHDGKNLGNPDGYATEDEAQKRLREIDTFKHDASNGIVAIDLADGPADAKWQLVFPRNAVRHRGDFPGGRVAFDGAFIDAMLANYAAEGKPERAVNYFHKGASHVDAPIDSKIAAGWIRDLRSTDRGLEALIKFNARAKSFIDADELRYLSPEFHPNADSKATGKKQGPTLFGAALLNDPFLTELPRVAASEVPEEKSMDPKQLAALLKLAETATEAEIASRIEALVAEGAKALAAGEAQTLALSDAQSNVVKLTEQLTALTKERDEFQAKEKAAVVKSFFDGLLAQGKITPATRPGYEALAMAHGVDGLKFLESAPAVVKPGEIGITGALNAASDRENATAKVKARILELEKGGATQLAAWNQTKVELPTEFALYLGASSASK